MRFFDFLTECFSFTRSERRRVVLKVSPLYLFEFADKWNRRLWCRRIFQRLRCSVKAHLLFNYFAEPAADDCSITTGGDEWESVNSDYGNKPAAKTKQAKKSNQ